MTRVLYLSYDGMTDPLGGSQVLPYITALAARGHRISLISFEKPGRSETEMRSVRESCERAGIDWHPLAYHKRPPILSTLFDINAMRRTAERLHADRPFDLIHCRSYPAAMVGQAMKRRHGVRFLFDMRGFWADERVEGGLWNPRNPLFRSIYRYFKRRETGFLRDADHIVSLTDRGRDILIARPDRGEDGPPIALIPCCVDFDSFPLLADEDRRRSRAALGIAPDRRVAAYLGSIGTWYMLGEMLDCFAVERGRHADALFLVVTRDDPGPILAAAVARGLPADSLMIRPARRDEVPGLLAAADYGLFFIRPTFSKSASCPTKLGEFLALGLPVVTNGGVGDVGAIVEQSKAGVLVERFDRAAYGEALDRLDRLTVDRAGWRERARRWFDLDQGVDRYDAIYREDASDRNSSTSRGE